jgi:hypothetical protein
MLFNFFRLNKVNVLIISPDTAKPVWRSLHLGTLVDHPARLHLKLPLTQNSRKLPPEFFLHIIFTQKQPMFLVQAYSYQLQRWILGNTKSLSEYRKGVCHHTLLFSLITAAASQLLAANRTAIAHSWKTVQRRSCQISSLNNRYATRPT